MAAQIRACLVRRVGGACALVAAAAAPAAAAAARPRGAGSANPFADFGPFTGVALTLDVINTLIVIYYVWRIWTRNETGPARTGANPEFRT